VASVRHDSQVMQRNKVHVTVSSNCNNKDLQWGNVTKDFIQSHYNILGRTQLELQDFQDNILWYKYVKFAGLEVHGQKYMNMA
jgi:hypothetical protein